MNHFFLSKKKIKMKKINPVFFSSVIFILLFTGSLNAQQSAGISANAANTKQTSTTALTSDSDGAKDNSSKATAKEMKAKLKEAKISSRINSHIAANFKNVSGLHIYAAEKGGMLAKFALGDKKVRVAYDKNGIWIYTIINCAEKDLPDDVKQLVYGAFTGFDITLVLQISQGDITCYKIFLEDCKNQKQIFVYNNEITIDKVFVK